MPYMTFEVRMHVPQKVGKEAAREYIESWVQCGSGSYDPADERWQLGKDAEVMFMKEHKS